MPHVSTPVIDALKENAGTVTFVGIAMLALGLFSLAAPAVAGASVSIMVGILLTIAGIGQCFLAFRTGAFGRALFILLIGLLMAVAGINMIAQPLAGMVSLTIILIAYLVITGLFELALAWQVRPAGGWGLLMINGAITVLLGVLLWQQFPLSGVWALGILLGVKLMMGGLALFALGRRLKSI